MGGFPAKGKGRDFRTIGPNGLEKHIGNEIGFVRTDSRGNITASSPFARLDYNNSGEISFISKNGYSIEVKHGDEIIIPLYGSAKGKYRGYIYIEN